MADITKCSDEECHRKEKCYRYKAESSKMTQSWFVESPRKGRKCEYFVPMKYKKV